MTHVLSYSLYATYILLNFMVGAFVYTGFDAWRKSPSTPFAAFGSCALIALGVGLIPLGIALHWIGFNGLMLVFVSLGSCITGLLAAVVFNAFKMYELTTRKVYHGEHFDTTSSALVGLRSENDSMREQAAAFFGQLAVGGNPDPSAIPALVAAVRKRALDYGDYKKGMSSVANSAIMSIGGVRGLRLDWSRPILELENELRGALDNLSTKARQDVERYLAHWEWFKSIT